MEILFNRLRGTGEIFRIGNIGINGNILYALYVLLAIGLVIGWWYGLGAMVLYVLGESSGWGKWVGYLISDNPKINYDDYEGRGFPYIHYIANKIEPERENYVGYCNIALALRGIQWWTPVYALIGYAVDELIWGIYLGILLGIMFPVACYLGKLFSFTFTYGKFECLNNWERQEIFYGLFQFIGIIIFVLFLYK